MVNVSTTSVINRHKRANHNRHTQFPFQFPSPHDTWTCTRRVMKKATRATRLQTMSNCHPSNMFLSSSMWMWMKNYERLASAVYLAKQQIIWHWRNGATRHQQQSINRRVPIAIIEAVTNDPNVTFHSISRSQISSCLLFYAGSYD